MTKPIYKIRAAAHRALFACVPERAAKKGGSGVPQGQEGRAVGGSARPSAVAQTIKRRGRPPDTGLMPWGYLSAWQITLNHFVDGVNYPQIGLCISDSKTCHFTTF